MTYLLLILLIVAVLYAPQLWVQWVLRWHSTELPSLPGTGGELATHLLKRFELTDVTVEQTEPNRDHYDPTENSVRLSPAVFNGKSLTAVAVAAHEVGHAIQFNRQEPVSQLRQRYFQRAARLQSIGITLLMFAPVVTAIVFIPHAMLVTALIGIMTMLISVLMYVAILPEEWDASFNKALPILLQGEYINDHQIKAVQQILRACAFTYVAAAMADILRLWRWIGILRGMR